MTGFQNAREARSRLTTMKKQIGMFILLYCIILEHSASISLPNHYVGTVTLV